MSEVTADNADVAKLTLPVPEDTGAMSQEELEKVHGEQPAAEPPAPPPPPDKYELAILDSRGHLCGYETVTTLPDPMPDDRIEVPINCDLAVGRYRWGVWEGHKAWVPVSGDPIANDPDALHAIWAGMRQLMREGKVKFPAVTVDWIAAYGRTWDAKLALEKQNPEKGA